MVRVWPTLEISFKDQKNEKKLYHGQVLINGRQQGKGFGGGIFMVRVWPTLEISFKDQKNEKKLYHGQVLINGRQVKL